MNWWKRKKRVPDESLRWKDHTARWLAAPIIGFQLQISRRLHIWEQKLSKQQRKILFLLLFLCCCGYLFYLFGRAILQNHVALPLPDPIKVPAIAQPPPGSPP